MIPKLNGLIAAPHTIFTPEGEVDLAIIEKQVEMLLRQNVIGAYVSGSTGEGVSCSVDERLQVMERWSECSKNRLKLIIHTGALSIRDVERLAARANELQLYATSVVPANYFKPGNMKMLVEFCRHAAAAAPDCKFYYYHTTMSGINMPMAEFLRAADGVIPNLAGIKFNSPDLYEFQKCQEALDGKYDIVYGVDEFFAGALALGAQGFIGSTYNYAASLYYDIIKAYRENRQFDVQKNMRKVCHIVDLLVRYGGVAGGKAMLKVQGLDGGDVRLPLQSLSEADKKLIAQETEKILS